jgi:hypothetical protein
LGEIVIDITAGAGDAGYATHMEEISRATKMLVETHGKNAARVAEQRAMNAELGGSGASAHIWRQIAASIREMQAPADLGSERNRYAEPPPRGARHLFFIMTAVNAAALWLA